VENYLKKVRAALGWTQEKMAAELNKSTSMVRFYERGAFAAPLEVSERVSEIARAHSLEYLIPKPDTASTLPADATLSPADYKYLDQFFPGIATGDLRSLQEAWRFFRDAPEEVAEPIAAAIGAWLRTYARPGRKQPAASAGSGRASRSEKTALDDMLYFVRHGDPDEVRELMHRAAVFRRYQEKAEKEDQKPLLEPKPSRHTRR
jgi:transcriptional regulator with XRE-family HTH domain